MSPRHGAHCALGGPTPSPPLLADPQTLAEAQDIVARLESAVHDSRIIGIATGVIMERFKISHQLAFRLLADITSDGDRSMRDVAVGLVDEAPRTDHA